MAVVLHTTAFLNSNGTTSLCTSDPTRKLLSISRNPQILRAKKLRFRVSLRASGVKDRDFAVLEDDPFSCYSWFSAQVKEGSDMKRSKEDEERQNYYVNTGYAIRSLREKLPELFYREINFDIYRDDIIFKDPRNTFVGIENYKSIFWAL